MRDAYGDPGMARLRPNLCECHPGATKQNTACLRGASVNNIHERDAMSANSLNLKRSAIRYFGDTPQETGILMTKMALRLQYTELLAKRAAEFVHNNPKASAGALLNAWLNGSV